MLTEHLLTGTLGTTYLLLLKKNQWKTLHELKNIQLKRLKAIVRYAYTYVPYYHRLFKSVKFKPEHLRSLEDLQKIPITTKMDVQRNFPSILAQGVDTSKCIEYFTSGSTGIPQKTYKDLAAASRDTILKAYAFLQCGVKLTDRFVNTARTRRSMFLPSQISVHFGQKDINLIIDYLRQINPDVIYSNPSILEDLCSSDTSGINPRLVFSQAQTLTEHCRSLVRSDFGIEINDTYGSTELGRLAFECNEHSGLHVLTDASVLEFIDDSGEWVAPKETGEIIATGLYNHAMPMIRYNLGDLGTPSDEQCSCGRKWPLISSIEGRVHDIFIMPSGRQLYPRFLFSFFRDERGGSLLKENPFSISQFQLVQKKKNVITLRIVKGRKFNKKILSTIAHNFETGFAKIGENVYFDLEIVKQIKNEESGKRKKIISLLR